MADIIAITHVARRSVVSIKVRNADDDDVELVTPNGSTAEVVRLLQEMHSGKRIRSIDTPLGQTPSRYPIPVGVETSLALEKTTTALVCINVLLRGKNVKDVAAAARVLFVRAADEHRWDASFTGAIVALVSSLGTPISPALNPLMDAAVDGAREDLRARGWSVMTGAPFELSWKVL